MPSTSKTFYWAAASIGIVAWTGAIIGVTSLPLITELALGGMGIVGAIWGHSVLFPRERPSGAVAGPGGASREEVLSAMGLAAQSGATQAAPARPRTNLPLHVNKAAREEALRLSEALNAVGLFGPVSVRMEPGGTALIAPVQEGEPVRVSAALVQHFASRAMAAPEALADQLGQNPAWPGRELAAALAAHIDMLERQAPQPRRAPTASAAPAAEASRIWPAANGGLDIRARSA
jgi:hypothetical protein